MMLNTGTDGIPDVFVIIIISFLVMYLRQESEVKPDNRKKNDEEENPDRFPENDWNDK